MKQEIKKRLDELKSKMLIIEWDEKHHGSKSRSHIYEELKREYGGLKEEFSKL